MALAEERQQSKKPLILIIEDEQFLCTLMTKKLEKAGFEVQGVYDGESGLKMVAEINPNVILLDILLPGIDGFEVLRRLKADERLREIPVIIISNLGEPQDIEKAKKEGAVAYLVKAEHSPEDIVKKVQQFM